MPALWETAAALSLPVFPCLPDKRPACAHGFKDAVTEPFQICELFSASPDATLIGVPTGMISGFDVLDIDSPRHPEAAHWERAARLPETRAHQTKSGGKHYLFQHAPGLRNWSSKPVPGVDGRADGGYIILWSAAGYAARPTPILEWPPALLSLFAKPAPTPRGSNRLPKITEPRVEQIVRRIAMASNGQRNDVLFWGANRVAEWIQVGQLPRGVGFRLLIAAATHAGLPQPEAERTINSAFARSL